LRCPSFSTLKLISSVDSSRFFRSEKSEVKEMPTIKGNSITFSDNGTKTVKIDKVIDSGIWMLFVLGRIHINLKIYILLYSSIFLLDFLQERDYKS
jgi:hypothetical protein